MCHSRSTMVLVLPFNLTRVRRDNEIGSVANLINIVYSEIRTLGSRVLITSKLLIFTTPESYIYKFNVAVGTMVPYLVWRQQFEWEVDTSVPLTVKFYAMEVQIWVFVIQVIDKIQNIFLDRY